jgi:hypothetical protein
MTGSTTMSRETQTAGDRAVLTIGGEPQEGAAGTYPVHNPARPAEIVGHARMETAVALNALLDRLPELRLDSSAPTPHVAGVAFRSPAALPVEFTPAA